MSNKSAMRRKRQLLKKFKTLSRVMSPKGDVHVQISGNSAYTDFQMINLPAGDFADDDYVALLEGAIDHEIGHIDETDKNASLEARSISGLHNNIRQVFEDVRMERCRMAKYPGSKSNLNSMVGQVIKRGWISMPRPNADPINLLQGFLLTHCRAVFCEQYMLKPYAKAYREQLSAAISQHMLAELDVIIAKIPMLTSNWGSLDLAKEVVALIEDEAAPPANDDADSSEGDSSSDDDADSSEGDSSSDDDADSSEGGNSAMRCSAAAQQMLDATEDEYIDDIHDMVRAGLEQDADEAQRAGDVVDGIDNQPFQISRHNVCGVMDKSAAIQASRRVKNPLHRVLFDMNKTERSYRRRGSNLDSDRLATVPAGTRNVFKHEQTTRAPNTAVSILVDNSDSMSWACTVNGVFHPENWKMETANACTYALSYSLHKLPGVTNEVLYYPRGYEGIHVAKSFSEKSAQPKNFEVNATGGTPTGPAMMAAIARLAVRDEPRKLLFVLTDGDPNSTVAVEQALEVALVTGVKVVAIGVGTNHVSGFHESGFVCVEDISTLHLAVKEAIAQSLLSVA